MEELKDLLSIVPFWFYEKFKLRKFLGKSRLYHISYPKRNEIFLNKLLKKISVFLENHGFQKKQKRIMVRENTNSI